MCNCFSLYFLCCVFKFTLSARCHWIMLESNPDSPLSYDISVLLFYGVTIFSVCYLLPSVVLHFLSLFPFCTILRVPFHMSHSLWPIHILCVTFPVSYSMYPIHCVPLPVFHSRCSTPCVIFLISNFLCIILFVSFLVSHYLCPIHHAQCLIPLFSMS